MHDKSMPATTLKTTTAPCEETHGAAKKVHQKMKNTTISQAVDSLKIRPRLPVVALLLLAFTSCQPVDAAHSIGQNASVLFNNGIEFDSSHTKADSRHHAAFFTSVHNATCAPSMAGRGGEPSGCRFLSAGLSTLPRARHPRLTAGASQTLTKEATMPGIALRTFRALFPLSARPVSTLPTMADARHLAAQLVAQNKRVLIQRAAYGFTVSEVKA